MKNRIIKWHNFCTIKTNTAIKKVKCKVWLYFLKLKELNNRFLLLSTWSIVKSIYLYNIQKSKYVSYLNLTYHIYIF